MEQGPVSWLALRQKASIRFMLRATATQRATGSRHGPTGGLKKASHYQRIIQTYLAPKGETPTGRLQSTAAGWEHTVPSAPPLDAAELQF